MFKPPRNSLLLKSVVIGLLAILMLIPLRMVEGSIAERASRRAEAIASVQASFAGPQTVGLPFVVWPYVEQWSEESFDAANRVRPSTGPSSSPSHLERCFCSICCAR